MSFKRLEVFVIVCIIGMIGVVYALTQKPALAPTTDDNNQNQNPGIAVGEPNPSMVIEYKGEDGKNALDLLKASHRVEEKVYSFGSFVTSIDSIEPDVNHFWAMYVNGEMSQVGAAQYITKSGDVINWKIEEVKQ